MKIFTNDIPFEIVTHVPKYSLKDNQYVLGNASVQQILKHYELISGGRVKGGNTHFIFSVKGYEEAVHHFKGYFQEVDAAGGIVEKDGQVLFIKRLGKWDLPKGKVEKGESLEETAVREVEEECRIKVGLQEKVGTTWHTYIRNNKHMLKCTHWYRMHSLDDTQLAPQTEENIEEVRWINKADVPQIAWPDTYQSIREIYRKYEATR